MLLGEIQVRRKFLGSAVCMESSTMIPVAPVFDVPLLGPPLADFSSPVWFLTFGCKIPSSPRLSVSCFPSTKIQWVCGSDYSL